MLLYSFRPAAFYLSSIFCLFSHGAAGSNSASHTCSKAIRVCLIVCNGGPGTFCFSFLRPVGTGLPYSLSRFPCICWSDHLIHPPLSSWLLFVPLRMTRRTFPSSCSGVNILPLSTTSLCSLMMVPVLTSHCIKCTLYPLMPYLLHCRSNNDPVNQLLLPSPASALLSPP